MKLKALLFVLLLLVACPVWSQVNVSGQAPLTPSGIGFVAPVVFTGAGLNDATSSGTSTAAASATYGAEIDATGAPDTFKWRKGAGAYTTGVAITGAAQLLTDGVYVTFVATTGHMLGDKWSITSTVLSPLVVKAASGSTKATIDNAGNITASETGHSIGFLQSGTGAVARTIQAKLQETISVKDFGAVGDGTVLGGGTDDTTAVQNALNAAITAQKELFFPAGNYRVTASIDGTVHDYIRIRGEGRIGATRIIGDFAADRPILDLVGSSYALIQDIQVQSATARTPSCGILIGRIDATGAGVHVFRNVLVYGDFRVAAVFGISSEANLFEKCWFWNPVTGTTPHGLLYLAFTAANVFGADITSAYQTLTCAGVSNSSNIIRETSFWDFATTATNVPLYLELAIDNIVAGNDIYTAGATAQIVLKNFAVNLTIQGNHPEYSGAEPYGIYMANNATYMISITASTMLPIYAVDGANVVLNIQGGYWYGPSGANTVVLDVDELYDSWIDVPETAIPPGTYVDDPNYRVRTTSTNNVFRGVPSARLLLSTATVTPSFFNALTSTDQKIYSSATSNWPLQIFASDGSSLGGMYEGAGGAGDFYVRDAAGATAFRTNAGGTTIGGGLFPIVTGVGNIGSATLPFADLYLGGTSGTPGTNNFKITGASTSGTRTITLPDASVTVNAAANISGTTLASNVVTSSLTSVGTLTGGATGAGFTVALGTSTITGILGSAYGGTGNGFTKFSGPTTAEKTFTLPDASSTIVVTSNNLSAMAATTSLQLLGVISDETGSGLAVFGTSPTITTPIFGSTATFGLAADDDTIVIDPVAKGAGQFAGTITSADLTGAQAWTFPNASITVNAAADISGTTLASNVVTSSLTTVGTIAAGTWNSTLSSAILGDAGNATRIRASLATPGTLANGDWWVECSGTTPSRTCSLKAQDTDATRTIVTSVPF